MALAAMGQDDYLSRSPGSHTATLTKRGDTGSSGTWHWTVEGTPQQCSHHHRTLEGQPPMYSRRRPKTSEWEGLRLYECNFSIINLWWWIKLEQDKGFHYHRAVRKVQPQQASSRITLLPGPLTERWYNWTPADTSTHEDPPDHFFSKQREW